MGIQETSYADLEKSNVKVEILLKEDLSYEVMESDQALDVVEHLPHIYDEPFADSSQIPTYLVSKLAREQVKVVLTGDGGDEQMAGYRRYKNCLGHWRDVQRVPQPAPVRSSVDLVQALHDRGNPRPRRPQRQQD